MWRTRPFVEDLSKEDCERKRSTEERDGRSEEEIAELEAQMAKNSIRDQQDEAKTAEADKRPRPFACWGCGELGHLLRTCSKRTLQEKKQLWEAHNSREATKDVRPIRVIRENEGGIDLLVGESLPTRQQEDPVGTIVRRRLVTDEVPTCEELEAESETTKKLATKWKRLEVLGDLVYRRSKSPKCG